MSAGFGSWAKYASWQVEKTSKQAWLVALSGVSKPAKKAARIVFGRFHQGGSELIISPVRLLSAWTIRPAGQENPPCFRTELESP